MIEWQAVAAWNARFNGNLSIFGLQFQTAQLESPDSNSDRVGITSIQAVISLIAPIAAIYLLQNVK